MEIEEEELIIEDDKKCEEENKRYKKECKYFGCTAGHYHCIHRTKEF